MRSFPVVRGDQRVALAPHDEDRDQPARCSQSPAYTRWPFVPTTERSVERKAARRSGSARCVTACDLGDVCVRPQPGRSKAATEDGDPTALPGPAVAAMKMSAPRERRRAKNRAHLWAQPTARHEHQAFGHLGELVSELHRDPAPERVADEHHAVYDSSSSQQVAQGCAPSHRASSHRSRFRTHRARGGRGR